MPQKKRTAADALRAAQELPAPVPARGRGRPHGSIVAEPTTPLPLRVPVRVLEALRERHGDGWAEHVRALLERDLAGDG